MTERNGPYRKEPKTSPRRLATALRRAKAIEMRLQGKRYPEIAEALGYGSRGAAVQDVSRALTELSAEPTAELRALELARLDDMWRRLDEARAEVLAVMVRRHVTVSNGKVVTLDGEPVDDDGVILSAVDRLMHIEDRKLRIQERRAKYLGLDAPKQVVISDDLLDAEIRSLTAEFERAAAGEASGTEAASD